ncbi:MAG: hypothetical protein J0I34_12110 [Pseudonocardia sp.]|uniref:hypothetical protein n=1 Tax=unclassified Pseudonocardia TaxID=2619320 RepID=UPI00086F85B7|nr:MULTISPECIES: hypothetical protein [unclassified Pseudonocardia]MBN9109517.1 hypothetical protein [Pseudonocardia sp.]ODU15585.1 MAG: hypothetical protein ABS80_20815 [Pseudonocardia sp. SCN 72-51]ODV05191.1 MAG: hypothetical protein ABT15_17875 [Pseudonocardia sp. SCN 73-27]
MSTAGRLAAYAAVLILLFTGAWATGVAVGPVTDTSATQPAGPGSTTETPGSDPNHASEHGHGDTGAADPGVPNRGPTGQEPVAAVESLGLSSTQAGYTFAVQNTSFGLGRPGELAFTISGPDGRPVTSYADAHHGPMQVAVVRRDAAGFQHLQPALGADGVWRAPLTLPGGGVWRAYADFAPTDGPPLVLGTDLFVQGDFTPFRFADSRTFDVDGYQVRLDGNLVPGTQSQIYATVSRNGTPVLDLEPYLGAFGHLAVLRQGDLAYLRVQPITSSTPGPTDRAGPGTAFTVDVPSAGSYRLFVEFVHGGVTRTAEFSVSTPEGSR